MRSGPGESITDSRYLATSGRTYETLGCYWVSGGVGWTVNNTNPQFETSLNEKIVLFFG